MASLASLYRLSSKLSHALSCCPRVPVTPGSGILRPFLTVPAFSARCSSSSPSSSSVEASGSSRTNVGICILNSSDKVFALSKLDNPGVWQMPQGVLYDKEDELPAAVVKKLKEETGVPTRSLRFEKGAWLQVKCDLISEERGFCMLQFGRDWKTRAHIWFYFRFTGKDEEISLLSDGKDKPQLAKWTWMSSEELVERALYCNKLLYMQAFEQFFSGASMFFVRGRDKKHEKK